MPLYCRTVNITDRVDLKMSEIIKYSSILAISGIRNTRQLSKL